ncbi:MAG: DUF4159 domain-containing protein [Phycisphaeraceae bacterium]
MKKFLQGWWLPVLVLAVGCATPTQAVAQDNALTDEQVGEAIEKIKQYLYDAQDPQTGGWFGAYHSGPNDQPTRNDWGPTAMAALALIVAGESPQHPQLARALKLLGEVEITGVYALSMRAHLWSYLPQGTFGGALNKDARTMMQTAYTADVGGKTIPARFDYIVYGAPGFRENNNRIDNSTTQYGILALWQASKRGIDVPKGFWVDAIDGFLKLQSDFDGGWAYNMSRTSSETMTCAGLTCLYVAQQELFRDQDKPNAKVQEAINAGLKYLDEHFGKHGGAHGGDGYLFYGYERVALASGRKYFGGQDWYQTIARKIVSRNGRYGDSIHNAAFHLMFLARGRVPVWINKLEIPDTDWNNRPNDVYFLNRFISEYREHEVNWQVVNINSDPADWIAAPLMWISSDEEIAWTDDQVAKMRTYIDLGGTIIANPEGGSRSFRNSIEDLASRLYPELEFTDMPADHPMANLLVGDPRQRKGPPIRMLTNGARVLMVMPQKDWGMKFQADKNPDPEKTDEWRYITNIYGVVTDRGELTPRLSSPMVKKIERPTTGTIKIVIPQWQDPAGKLPEHDVYRMMKNYMHNETGKQLLIEELPLAELESADPSLLHMVGVNAVKVEESERTAIQNYLAKGGNILVENLGGTGDFAQSIRDQLGPVFPGDENTVSIRKGLITGIGLPEGNKNNRRLVYRRLVLERSNPDARLLLRGYEKDNRYPVLLSYEDLSLGMLGVRQYGINGYGVETARDLMVNILLDANQAYPGSTQPHSPAEEAVPE